MKQNRLWVGGVHGTFAGIRLPQLRPYVPSAVRYVALSTAHDSKG